MIQENCAIEDISENATVDFTITSVRSL